MQRKRSLDDTCDIFLSRGRRVRSILLHNLASEFPRDIPTLRAENITIAPYFNLIPRPLEIPELSATALTPGLRKPLPLPGSSGTAQQKPAQLPDGRRHVPRPRNPFILFRCDLVHQRKMLPRSDMDDTNISRIAGDLWREMTAEQKRPWVELAAQEKTRHALLYPDYKYAPTHGGSRSKRTKDDSGGYLETRLPRQGHQPSGASPRSRYQHERPRPYPQCIPRRRSSSCPPVGAIPVPSHSPVDEWSPPLVTRDDLERRPSRTIMYQSVTSQPVDEPTLPAPATAAYEAPLPLEGFDWFSPPQIDMSLLDPTYPLLDMSPGQSPDSYSPVSNLGFFDPKPTFVPSMDPCFTAQELEELERLSLGTTFIDPFSTLNTVMPSDADSPFAFSAAISPFDCSGYSTASPSSSASSPTKAYDFYA